MDDRTLLELAAKTAGADHNGYRYGKNGKEPLYGMPIKVDDGIEYQPWNPLTDDGDALRLAVMLQLGISIPPVVDGRIEVVTFYGPIISIVEYPQNDDRQAATRRAIVRAAAEIGKNIK